uniref:Uncharacterized protein n=1 Tax=Arundo donax TaxID=35708 RepID=A0A0A8Y0K9_ARUDO
MRSEILFGMVIFPVGTRNIHAHTFDFSWVKRIFKES